MYFQFFENTNIISFTCVMNLNLLQRYITLQEKQVIIDLVLFGLHIRRAIETKVDYIISTISKFDVLSYPKN